MKSVSRVEVAKMFLEIGVSLRTVFPDPESNIAIYSHHRWEMAPKPNVREIHVIPKGDAWVSTFWEQWVIDPSGSIIHRVLFNAEPELPYHDTYTISHNDNLASPPLVFGRFWYMMELPSLLAWGVRALLISS
mgnify:CR=1 FL=1